MIKAIFFDIDDTLYSTTAFAEHAREAALESLRAHGVRPSLEALQRELNEVISEFSSNYNNHFDKLLLRLTKHDLPQANPAILIAAAVRAYHDAKQTHLNPFEDVPPLFQSLAKTDLIRGIITAGLQIKQAEKLLRLQLYPYVTPTAIFISDQIGISKPNPKLYLKALSDTGIAPKEAIYIGDHPLHDIDPANQVGLNTILSNRGTKYSHVEGKTKPHHTIGDFTELLTLLTTHYKIHVPQDS